MLEQERVRSIEHAERITVGAMLDTRVRKLVSDSRSYGTPELAYPADLTEDAYFDLPIALDQVWRHERDIDLAFQEEGRATELGSEILSALDCDADEFFENVETGKFRRLLHVATDSTIGLVSFRGFVDRCASVDKVAKL